MDENSERVPFLETPSSRAVGKFLRVESLRYVYLVKKTILHKLKFQNLIKDAKDLDESDYLISQELKKYIPLYMLADLTYGELVSYRLMQEEHKSNLEFHRIIENFNLWTNRYIQPQVSNLGLTFFDGLGPRSNFKAQDQLRLDISGHDPSLKK